MYELYQVGEKSYYVDCPAKIGIYQVNENAVYLIDSGSDKAAGRKIRKILNEHHWQLLGILNTNSHADHIGGNHYLQQKTGCKIYSSSIEKWFAKYPILEPYFLYGGYPCKKLRHKFLLANESEVQDFSDQDFPKEIEIIPLRGHFFDMVGFRTPDDVVYLADCLLSKETLDKYKIVFLYDVEKYLNALERIKMLKAKIFVPAHAPVTENIVELAEYNILKVNETANYIVELCKIPSCFEVILKKLSDDFGLKMNFEQYVLVGSTVRSYLAWLKDMGKLEAYFENNQLIWKMI